MSVCFGNRKQELLLRAHKDQITNIFNDYHEKEKYFIQYANDSIEKERYKFKRSF